MEKKPNQSSDSGSVGSEGSSLWVPSAPTQVDPLEGVEFQKTVVNRERLDEAREVNADKLSAFRSPVTAKTLSRLVD